MHQSDEQLPASVATTYTVPCEICGQPLVLAFQPLRGKRCDNCTLPYDPATSSRRWRWRVPHREAEGGRDLDAVARAREDAGDEGME